VKKIGLLGGLSWESSVEYYRIINQLVNTRLGKAHSADCLLYSFDFQVIEELQHAGKWQELTELLIAEANNLKLAGAEFLAICTNTMHLMAPQIEESTGLKLVHIADATAAEAIRRNVDKVLLLGTKFTMEGTFYTEKLKENRINVIIPEEPERQIIHDIIYRELVRGALNPESKQLLLEIIDKLRVSGFAGVVLGCTELPLLLKQSDLDIELFDTTEIHSRAIVDYALA